MQGYLEKALSTVANTTIEVQCAGRTDAGVHATGQVVHFDCEVARPLKAWTMGVNANLPDSVAVKWCCEVSDEFHARFSATGRRYRYLLLLSANCTAATVFSWQRLFFKVTLLSKRIGNYISI